MRTTQIKMRIIMSNNNNLLNTKKKAYLDNNDNNNNHEHNQEVDIIKRLLTNEYARGIFIIPFGERQFIKKPL